MPYQFALDDSSLKDFEIFLTLDTDKIKQITDVIKNLSTPPLRPSDLQGPIEKFFPDRVEDAKVFVRQLLLLYNLKRKADINTKELLDELCFNVEHSEEPWLDDDIIKLKALEPVLIDLLSLPQILYVVKTLSLSYDHTNFSQSIKILTDIRPVYDEDAEEIVGAIVSHSLRLYYQDVEGQQSISIGLDEVDVRMLLKSCQRALTKANTAERFMKDQEGIKTLVRGREN